MKRRRRRTKLRPASSNRGAAELIQVGLKHHQAGRSADAEACYRQVLTAQPDHADAFICSVSSPIKQGGMTWPPN
jgi:hypothetical protein